MSISNTAPGRAIPGLKFMDSIARAVADPFNRNETISMSRVQHQLLIGTVAEDMYEKAKSELMARWKPRDEEAQRLIKEAKNLVTAQELEIQSLKGQVSAAREDRGMAWSQDKAQLQATITRLDGKLQEQTNKCLESDLKVRQLQPALAEAQTALGELVKTGAIRKAQTIAFLDAAIEKVRDRWPNGNPFSDLFLQDLVRAKEALEL